MSGSSCHTMASSRSNQSLHDRPSAFTRLLAISAVVVFVIACVVHTVQLIYWTPPVQHVESDAHVFAEDRAMRHVLALSEDIGWRQVSTQGVLEAEEYIYRQAILIQDLAHEIARRSAFSTAVEVTREHLSGGISMGMFGMPLTNAFRNLSAVSWYVQPPGSQGKPAVLVMAHFDSPVGSAGACDDASNVAVMLEAARSLVASRTTLTHPVLFVANGGEETFSQAAYGFMQSSVWRSRIGAFINLESTGSGGPPIMFQGAAWTVAAYASGGAPSRGSSLAQDFFEAGLIPADTDFRMLSFTHYGSLPGVDVAHLLDASAYHTDRDTAARMRPGCMQEIGEKLLDVLPAFAAGLKTNRDEPNSAARVVFFNPGFNIRLLVYPLSLGRWLHSIPLFLCLLLPILLSPVADASKGRHILWHAALAYVEVLECGLRSTAGSVAALLTPAVIGIGRAVISGKPLIWFSNNAVVWPLFVPSAIAAAVLCVRDPQRRQQSTLFESCQLPHSALQDALGAAMMHSAAAAALTVGGWASAFLPAVWAWTAMLHIALMIQVPAMVLHSPWPTMFAALPALLTTLGTLITFVLYVLGKVSMAGSPPGPLGIGLIDGVVGALVGFLTFLVIHTFLPLVRLWAPAPGVSCAAPLLAVSLLTAAASSVLLPVYTDPYPKRVLLQHLHRTVRFALARTQLPSDFRYI